MLGFMHICCVCTGNTCRSPMLACLLRAEAERQQLELRVSSAGVAAASGMNANPNACSCMEQRGLDLSQHRSQSLLELDLVDIDRFYCMSEQHAFALLEGGIPQERLHLLNAAQGGIPDPFGGSLEVYQQCASVLEECAAAIITDLKQANPQSEQSDGNG